MGQILLPFRAGSRSADGMQFSFRTLLAGAAVVVGIGAALWVAKPSWQVGAVDSILVTWILASAAKLIIHTTGKAKAFWLGVGIQCTLPIAILMAEGLSFGVSKYGLNYFQAALYDVSYGFRPVMATWAFAPVVGLLCVLMHWLFGSLSARRTEAMERSESTDAKRSRKGTNRRWFQFSMRTVFVVVTLLCVALSLWVVPAERQRRAVKAIEALRGTVTYVDSQTTNESFPTTFLRRWLPQAYVDEVEGVDFSNNTKVTDADLAHLQGLTGLKWLLLDKTQITDAGLVHLEGLAALQTLTLINTQVTDAGLAHLKGLTGLKWLLLDNTQVTDAGLAHLQGLTSLQHLWLYGTQVTVAGAAKLGKALPNCVIDVLPRNLYAAPDRHGSPPQEMKPTRRWFQYSLRSFLVLMTALAVWLVVVVNRAREQREAVKAIKALGSRVHYDWQIVAWHERNGLFTIDGSKTPPGPSWLRRLVGDDYFQNVEVVILLGSESNVNAAIPHLRRLPSMKMVCGVTNNYRRSPATVDKLKAALPDCELAR